MTHVVGLITEYNPFHNGHKYHIEKAKEVTGADYAVIVMSGNFVQRGAPAIASKYTRTKMALECGGDLVIELPTVYATSSAEHFALGSIAALENTGIVDSVCFGSECGNCDVLASFARLYVEEPNSYQVELQRQIKMGESFPSARQKATLLYSKNMGSNLPSEIISSPNNILGIEYLKAILRLKSKIRPYTITREGASYHEINLHESMPSASSLRSHLQQTEDLSFLQNKVPQNIISILEETNGISFPIDSNDFSTMLYFALCSKSEEELCKFKDVSKDLANRLKNHLHLFTNWSEYALLLKSKQYTLTRITRVFTHILLNIVEDPFFESRTRFSSELIPYLRILGARKESTGLIREIKKQKKESVTLMTKASKALPQLSDYGKELFETDSFSTNLYHRICYEKFGVTLGNDFTSPFLLI